MQDNFNDLLPAAPAGRMNVKWQADPSSDAFRNISANIPIVGGPGSSVALVNEIPIVAIYPGNFSIPHGLSSPPAFVIVQMTSGGDIWLQSPTSFDATNVYLVASDAGVSAILNVWSAAASAEISLAGVTVGNNSIPHGLGSTPTLALIEMLSSGAIWFQSPTPWDATNLYLVASDNGLNGKAEVWLQTPQIAQPIGFSKLSLSPGAPGNFTVAHGLGRVPQMVIVRMTSGGNIWLQTPTSFDATNLYLAASDAGITGEAEIWTGTSSSGSGAGIEIALAPGAPGNFTVAHGLAAKPKTVLIQMTSGGAIWFQTARYDATNIYLTASDSGITGYAEIWP